MAFSFLNGYKAETSVVRDGTRTIDAVAFAAEVAAFRPQLQTAQHVINLCDNRLAFLVAFAGALQNRQITLLPSDIGEFSLRQLCEQYESTLVVTDNPLPFSLPVDIQQCFPDGQAPASTVGLAPIPEEQPAVIVHTSGSTGVPQPHVKSWGALVRRAREVGQRLELASRGINKVVGTVPSQHMYGVENAIMLPLQCGLTIHAERPLFPADIAEACDAHSLLVTTPIHLRSLTSVDSGARTGMILSSTAPLSPDQARRAESTLETPLREIFGSTETGVIATRSTATTAAWHVLDSLTLSGDAGAMQLCDESGSVTPLHDSIELLDSHHFTLGARVQDIVKVAGKRASLSSLTQALCSIEGVRDGVFLAPDGDNEVAARMVAFVVAPDLDTADIVTALRSRIASTFMPRPLIKVESLPRNATGKLPREALLALWRDTRG